MSITTIVLVSLCVVIMGLVVWFEGRRGSTRHGPQNAEEDRIRQIKIKKVYLYVSAFVFVVLMLQGFYLFQVDPKNIIFTIPSALAIEVAVTYGIFKWIFLVFVALYLWRTFVTLYPDEQAALLLFGRELFSVSSGLFPVWLGFCNLVYGPKKRQQREFPADFDKIWHGSTDTVPEGKVEPFRITTGGKDNLEESDGPLEGRLTLNVAFFAAFRVVNMPLVVGVLGITDEKDMDGISTGRLTVDIEEGFRQIQDTAKRVLNALFGTKTPKWIIEHQDEVATILATKLDELVRFGEYRWGVDLEEVALSLVGLSHTLNTALSSVPTARFEAQAFVTKGQSEARVVFLKGEQAAIVHRLQLEADAIGLEALANRLGLQNNIPALTALVNAKLAETGLQAIGEGGGKIVLVGGGGAGAVQNILGLVEGLRGENA